MIFDFLCSQQLSYVIYYYLLAVKPWEQAFCSFAIMSNQKNCKHERKKWKKIKSWGGKTGHIYQVCPECRHTIHVLVYIHAAFLWKLEATSRRLQTSSKFRQTYEVECFFVSSPLVVVSLILTLIFQTENFKRLRILFCDGSKSKVMCCRLSTSLEKKCM